MIGGVDYSAYYKGGSLHIDEKNSSERTTFSFQLENPPSIPQSQAPVYIWESPLKRRTFPEAAGRIIRPATKDVSGSAHFTISIECGGWIRDLERVPLTGRSYNNATSGFIFRDLMTFTQGFSITNVILGGAVWQYFENRNATLPSLFDALAKANGWFWWVDTLRNVYFNDPVNMPAPFQVTDATINAVCLQSTFLIEPDTSNLVNQARMSYSGKYNEGTVNVSNGLTSVTGNGTLFSSRVKPGSFFQIYANTNIGYTVQKVVNDTQLLLTSAYAEPSLSNQQYAVTNIPMTTQETEASSIALMKAIATDPSQSLPDTGIFFGNIDPPATYLTFPEAKQYLKGQLSFKAYPTTNISFHSDSRKIPGQVFAGQSVYFGLPKYKMDTTLQITQITKTDIGATDENGYPLYTYEFRFETRLYDLASHLRIMQISNSAMQDSGATGDDITGVYLENPQFTEVSDIMAGGSAKETVLPVENITALDNSPNGIVYHWGVDGQITINPNGSATDAVTGNPVISWGYFEWSPNGLVTQDGDTAILLEDGFRLAI